MTEEKERSYKTRFEFVLLFNNHIIVQRNFNIWGYNSKSILSTSFKDVVDYCGGKVFDTMKTKSMNHLYDYEYMYASENFIDEPSDDVYKFQVIVDDRVVIESMIDASVFPKKVRRSVDIRKQIPDIISSLQQVMSLETENLVEIHHLKGGE